MTKVTDMRKTLKLVRVDHKLWIYSNYTGAIEPVSLHGFIAQVTDLIRF